MNPLGKIGFSPNYHGTERESVLMGRVGRVIKEFRLSNPDVHPASLLFTLMGLTRSVGRVLGFNDIEMVNMFAEVGRQHAAVSRDNVTPA